MEPSYPTYIFLGSGDLLHYHFASGDWETGAVHVWDLRYLKKDPAAVSQFRVFPHPTLLLTHGNSDTVLSWTKGSANSVRGLLSICLFRR
jgi:hypothetical protein